MNSGDIRSVGKVVALTGLAWLLPPKLWRKAAAATIAFSGADSCQSVYEHYLAGRYSQAQIAEISTRRRTYMRELRLQILRLARPWHAWQPDIRLHGIEHLQNALAAGHGAILWVTETTFSTLIVKMALHHAGYRAVHLSRPSHGFSISDFGARYLNPLWAKIENRFIAERVVIHGERSTDALARLRARLAENRVVTITVGQEAHRFVEAPFLDGRMKLPTGPLRLAKTARAPLIPVFTVAHDDGTFTVEIAAPLPANASEAGMAAVYASQLEAFVLDHPEQWNGWFWPQVRLQATTKCDVDRAKEPRRRELTH